MVKAGDVFGDVSNPEGKVKEVKTWLNSKGVRDFEPVSLFCDQLGKVCFMLDIDTKGDPHRGGLCRTR